jgi:PAS domain S-box-containing protein
MAKKPSHTELIKQRDDLLKRLAELEDQITGSAPHGETDLQSRLHDLEKTEEKFRRFTENLGGDYIFYTHNREGMITFISPSVEKILGYTPEEAQRNFREFLTDHEMNRESLRCSEQSLNGIAPGPFLNELYHRDGSTRIFYNTEIPVFDESGQVTEVDGIASDVTDRIKTEEELKRKEEYFRLLVETISEVFWIFDMKRDRLVYVSPHYEKIYGKSRQSLYRNPGSFLKLIHADDVDRVKKAYRRISKGTGINEEYRILRADGETLWIWSKSFIVFDEKNRPWLSIGNAQDVTVRKQDQLEKDMLAAIVENTGDHAVIKDTDLRVIASNRANTLAAGKKKMEEMIGKTDLELYGDHEHVRQYIEDDRKALKLKKGETLVNEQVFVFSNKKKIHTLVKKFPVYDTRNQVIGVASISRNISDYKNALEDLAKSEQNLKMLIDNQGEGIGLINDEFRFIFSNPRAGEVLGVDHDRLIKRSLLDFVSRVEGRRIQKELAKLDREDKAVFEAAIKTPGGEKKHLLFTAKSHETGQEHEATFIIFRDITKRKLAENELRQSEKQLREAVAAKDRFLSIIAHDLKNPFHSILGFSRLLMNHLDDYDRDEIYTFARMINESCQQSANLLDNLLNWSRIQTGKIRYNPGTTKLQQVINDSIKLLQNTADAKNIELKNQVNEDAVIYADRNMMSTIFRNLISNAIKFTRPAGTVTISSKARKKFMEISVEDNGVGIPEQEIDNLFRIDRYFSTTGTANEEGTGLGLVLCKDFISMNRGTIEVKSKPNKGSRFIITVPCLPENKDAGEGGGQT